MDKSLVLGQNPISEEQERRQFALDVDTLLGPGARAIGVRAAVDVLRGHPDTRDRWANEAYVKEVVAVALWLTHNQSLEDGVKDGPTNIEKDMSLGKQDLPDIEPEAYTDSLEDRGHARVVGTVGRNNPSIPTRQGDGAVASTDRKVKKRELLREGDVARMIYLCLEGQGVSTGIAEEGPLSLQDIQGPFIKYLGDNTVDRDFCEEAGISFGGSDCLGKAQRYEGDRLFYWLGLRSRRKSTGGYEVKKVSPLSLGEIARNAGRGNKQSASEAKQSLLSALAKVVSHLDNNKKVTSRAWKFTDTE